LTADETTEAIEKWAGKETAFIATFLRMRLCEARAYGYGMMGSSSARTVSRWSKVSRICILVVIVQHGGEGLDGEISTFAAGREGSCLAAVAAAE
jgi:hypothetical protein